MTSICGHRGASGHAPENTLIAFEKARQLGAIWLEFDVQLCQTGEVIVLHDDTLERTTDLKQPVRPIEFSLSALKNLDAGSWFSPEFAGEPIPTLEEVLERFGGTLGLNIEIKSKIGVESNVGIEAKIAEMLQRYNLFDSVIVSSFDPTRLFKMQQVDSRVKLGVLYSEQAFEYMPSYDPIKIAKSLGAVALHPDHKLVTADLVAEAGQAGLAINTWTVNEPTDMHRMLDLGVAMIITNYPDKLKSLL